MKNDGNYLIQLRESSNSENQNEESDSLIEKPFMSKSAIKYNLLFKVRTLYGRTKVILSSPLQIENNTKVKLFILIELNERIVQWKNTLRQELTKYEEISINSEGVKREYAVIFELLPNKIYYVPLVVAYNCKIYSTPNLKMYNPSLIFDVRGYNLRIDECGEVKCQKFQEAIDENKKGTENVDFDNDFILIRQLSLNVKKTYKNLMLGMHANYKVCNLSF